MIPHLRGWTKEYAGETVTYFPPEGSVVGGVRYRERVRPLCRTSVAVGELLARFPQFVETEREPIEKLVTAEGEYAALVTIRGTLRDAPAQRDVGLVFGDDFYALLSALVVVPDRFATFTEAVRTLVLADSHALGVRRRRYLYAPPPGWQGLPRGFTTEWSPPDFPNDLTVIHAYPANPASEPPSVIFDQMLGDDEATGFERAEVAGPEPLQSRHGLGGQRWRIVGRFPGKPRSTRDLVVYKDARYLYSMRLETMNDELLPRHHETFLEMARSVEPIPTGGAARSVGPLVSHWTS